MTQRMKTVISILMLLLCTGMSASAQPLSDRNELLDLMKGVAEYLATLQDDAGAIIDPFIDKEHQYSTPYFAAGVACLVHAGQATDDLKDAGCLAMDKATHDLEKGHDHIPDGHGEFYLASLTQALEWFKGHVEETRWKTWQERLRTPLDTVIESRSMKINNWRTYAMKSEWLRAQAGLVDKQTATDFIEDAWHNRTQRERIVQSKHHLYQDWNGDPQSHAVEAVGRGNLIGLIAHGYDGPSATEIQDAVFQGTGASRLLQSPDGQCPPNGRTDNHVFNDLLYALIFDTQAQALWSTGDAQAAGEYHRAAQLGYGSIQRWQYQEGPWTGAFSITKNFFDPAERVGYQPASQFTNYNATVLFHLAEAWHTWKQDIPIHPARTEAKSFTIENDPAFDSVVMNARGTQIQTNLRGDSVPKYGAYWTPLGIVRLAKSDWDSRLGPMDGHYDARKRRGVSFCPAWQERGKWVNLTQKAQHYRGTFTRKPGQEDDEQRASILYAPVTGVGGPSFYMDLILRPGKLHITLRSPNAISLGLTVPCIESDGKTKFSTTLEDNVLRTSSEEYEAYREVHVLNDAAEVSSDDILRSAVGDLVPWRISTNDETLSVQVLLN